MPVSALWGCGGTTTASPFCKTAAEAVASGSPARNWRSLSRGLPASRRSASADVTHRPSLVMPMGTTSYLCLSIALKTEAAESSEISCSPLRPPKRIPTLILSVMNEPGICGNIQFVREPRLPSITDAVPKVHRPKFAYRGLPLFQIDGVLRDLIKGGN